MVVFYKFYNLLYFIRKSKTTKNRYFFERFITFHSVKSYKSKGNLLTNGSEAFEKEK